MIDSLERTTAPDELRRDLRLVGDIVEQPPPQRDQIRRAGEMAPPLNVLTAAIEQHWLELPEDIQKAILETGEAVDRFLESGQQQKVHRSVFERLWARFTGEERNDIFEFTLAVSRFRVAIVRAMANESRLQSSFEQYLSSDAEAVAAINQGYDEFEAGAGTVYTAEEYRLRLNTA